MLTIAETATRFNMHLKRSNPAVLSGKSRLNHLKQNRQSSSENTTFRKFYSTKYEIELLLQIEFEFMKVQQNSSLTENER